MVIYIGGDPSVEFQVVRGWPDPRRVPQKKRVNKAFLVYRRKVQKLPLSLLPNTNEEITHFVSSTLPINPHTQSVAPTLNHFSIPPYSNSATSECSESFLNSCGPSASQPVVRPLVSYPFKAQSSDISSSPMLSQLNSSGRVSFSPNPKPFKKRNYQSSSTSNPRPTKSLKIFTQSSSSPIRLLKSPTPFSQPSVPSLSLNLPYANTRRLFSWKARARNPFTSITSQSSVPLVPCPNLVISPVDYVNSPMEGGCVPPPQEPRSLYHGTAEVRPYLGRGITLAWKHGVDFEPLVVNKNQISNIVYSDPPSNPWLLSAVYGPPYMQEKPDFWNSLADVGRNFGGPWLIIGDLNVILMDSNRTGGSSNDHFLPFVRDLFHKCGLLTIQTMGGALTWDNYRGGSAHI
ncbi:Endonuclease/exonuclease/phosphatase [Trema orientale]|uniref:Endonuclease/exonuclease/phosphatase n=1 Tax=Trema orientale TaxID=63057 RepID=A0A2P5FA07_TREOI|nr:Endonuclease/exonuclease/phosphatase [Trema orientale]